jgi:hypothetical protein
MPRKLDRVKALGAENGHLHLCFHAARWFGARVVRTA